MTSAKKPVKAKPSSEKTMGQRPKPDTSKLLAMSAGKGKVGSGLVKLHGILGTIGTVAQFAQAGALAVAPLCPKIDVYLAARKKKKEAAPVDAEFEDYSDVLEENNE